MTGLSPCILPVLPVVFSASAIGEREDRPWRRPLLIVAGLGTSFAFFTLFASAVIAALGLPSDFLRNASLVLMAVVGLALVFPAVGHIVERPFARIPQRSLNPRTPAFAFGALFGLAFVPCAGPVLAAITVLSATQGVSARLLLLTIAFTVGVCVPLFGLAMAGQQLTSRTKALRTRLPLLRRITGGILVATSVVLALGAVDGLQRIVPGYTQRVQAAVESGDSAQRALSSLQTDVDAPRVSFDDCETDPTQLQNCGPAPELRGISDWLNSEPLSLADLRGRVVLVDFWTYSCINCQRTLPYLEKWDEKYRDAGLTIIGVHSPEFEFEHDVSNVAQAASDLGVEYPIAIDNEFKTWRAYDQRFWPAHYLIDQNGTVRQVHYGEGAYEQTEQLIRTLLKNKDTLPAAGDDRETPNQAGTPETYLGAKRGNSYADQTPGPDAADYAFPASMPNDSVALSGRWLQRPEYIEAVGSDSKLRLNYSAAKVFAVLGGQGTVTVRDSAGTRAVDVSGAPTLYPVRDGAAGRSRLTLSVPAGVQAYSFTFG
ncbi:MAG: cytochrome c biogenesis protein DipZ [Candidatus Nanopelagicales bacterium]